MVERIDEGALSQESEIRQSAQALSDRLAAEQDRALDGETIRGPGALSGGFGSSAGSGLGPHSGPSSGLGLDAAARGIGAGATGASRPGVANPRPLAHAESGVGALSRADLGQEAAARGATLASDPSVAAERDLARASAQATSTSRRATPLTGPTGAPVDAEGIELLNRAIATEIVCALRYARCAIAAKGIHSKGVAAEFAEHAQEEWAHMGWLAERVGQLGGDPNLDPAGVEQRSHCGYRAGDSLDHMIEANLTAERQAVAMYRAMIARFEGDPTTRRLLEKILAQEEEHADDLATLLGQ